MNRRQFIAKSITGLAIATPAIALSQATAKDPGTQNVAACGTLAIAPALSMGSSRINGWKELMRMKANPKGLCCLMGPYCRDEKPPDCDFEEDYPF